MFSIKFVLSSIGIFRVLLLVFGLLLYTMLMEVVGLSNKELEGLLFGYHALGVEGGGLGEMGLSER
jgi:hypothetical protein